MKFNSRELAVAASLPNPDKEGKLAYKKPQKATGFKDKWFRLKGNLLFYYSWDLISTGSTFDFSSPQGVVVLERIRVQHEPHHPEQSFVFSISFDVQEGGDSHMGSHDYASVAKAKHYFSGRTLEDCEDWVQRFRQSSTESLKSHILVLQAKILNLTGVDPLDAFFMNPKVDFRNTGGGLKLHHLVDIPNPPSDHLRDDDDGDIADDRTSTLTNDSSTLKPSSNALGPVCIAAACVVDAVNSAVISVADSAAINATVTAADAAQNAAHDTAPSTTAERVVPVIVIEVEDESKSHSPETATILEPLISTGNEAVRDNDVDRHPSRPSVVVESQRLGVENSGLSGSGLSGFSDSDSGTSSSGSSPASSPKAIKAAAKVEKREKMPRKSAGNDEASAAAAEAVRKRLAMMATTTTVGEEVEEEEKDENENTERSPPSLPSKTGARNAEKPLPENDAENIAGKPLPRAPPRHRSRSRRSNSMKKQLSLIEEEEKGRSASTTKDELPDLEEGQRTANSDDEIPTTDSIIDPLGSTVSDRLQAPIDTSTLEPAITTSPSGSVQFTEMFTRVMFTPSMTESTDGLASDGTDRHPSDGTDRRASDGTVQHASDGTVRHASDGTVRHATDGTVRHTSSLEISVNASSIKAPPCNDFETNGETNNGESNVKNGNTNGVTDGITNGDTIDETRGEINGIIPRFISNWTSENDTEEANSPLAEMNSSSTSPKWYGLARDMAVEEAVVGTDDAASDKAVNESLDVVVEAATVAIDGAVDFRSDPMGDDGFEGHESTDTAIVNLSRKNDFETEEQNRLPLCNGSSGGNVCGGGSVGESKPGVVEKNLKSDLFVGPKSNSGDQEPKSDLLAEIVPKPKPRSGHKSSMRLSALLPSAPTRPKRKANSTKTKSSSAKPKQSSFQSFLVEDEEEKASNGRESNA